MWTFIMYKQGRSTTFLDPVGILYMGPFLHPQLLIYLFFVGPPHTHSPFSPQSNTHVYKNEYLANHKNYYELLCCNMSVSLTD